MRTVDELAGSLKAHEQRKKKKEETLEQTLQTKASSKDEKVLYSQNFRVRGWVVAVKVVVMKDNGANQIDVVKEEVTSRTFSTLSATNVTSIVTTQRIATSINAIIVVKWDILRKIIEPKKRLKKRPT